MSLLSPLFAATLMCGAVEAAEYREVELTDGRILVGEVAGMGAEGMSLQLAQGLAVIPLSDILTVVPATREQVEAAEAWKVLLTRAVAPSGRATTAAELDELMFTQLDTLPGVDVRSAASPDFDPRSAERLGRCRLDWDCVLGEGARLGADVIVLPAFKEGEEGALTMELGSSWVQHPLSRQIVSAPWPDEPAARPGQVMATLYPMLSLQPDLVRIATVAGSGEEAPSSPPDASANPASPDAATPEAATPKAVTPEAAPPPQAKPQTSPPESDSGEPVQTGRAVETITPPVLTSSPLPDASGNISRTQVAVLSFVPVPGFSSLVQRDLKRFGLAWAAVVPASLAMVGVTGSATYRRPQFLGVSAAGYYVITVAANQITGIRSFDGAPVLSVVPTRGGVAASLIVPLK